MKIRWYIEKGPDFDVVMSSRVRLARNFAAYPFPSVMNAEQAVKILDIVKSASSKISSAIMQPVRFINMSNIEAQEKQVMVEKHIISQEMADSRTNSGILLSDDERLSVMVNEEDHLRMQTLYAGMQLSDAWKECSKIDDLFEQESEYAFDPKYGYLACCPTNVGTGMRASVMLHLPALSMTGYIKRVLETCNKLGITARGIYGEHSEALGNIFQISNQVTLGLTEEEIVSNVSSVARQIIEQERMLRNELRSQNTFSMEDRIYRAEAILSSARILSSDECMKLLSDVRLGVNMNIIKDIELQAINELTVLIQPASLQKECKQFLSAEERDVKRAELVRAMLYEKYK